MFNNIIIIQNYADFSIRRFFKISLRKGLRPLNPNCAYCRNFCTLFLKTLLRKLFIIIMTSKETVYGAFVDYFGDIALKLIKNEGGWAVYAAKVHSGLNLNRYIFVISPAQQAYSEQVKLNDLDWVSFQTRTTDDVHQVPTHHLYLNDDRKKALPDVVTVTNRTADETIYITNSLPIRVRLMHDPKKKNHLQYPDKAKLYQALDTFNCVVDLL